MNIEQFSYCTILNLLTKCGKKDATYYSKVINNPKYKKKHNDIPYKRATFYQCYDFDDEN